MICHKVGQGCRAHVDGEVEGGGPVGEVLGDTDGLRAVGEDESHHVQGPDLGNETSRRDEDSILASQQLGWLLGGD